MNLSKEITKKVHTSKQVESKPLILSLKKSADRKKLEDLFKSGVVKQVVDEYVVQLEELFFVNNPHLVFAQDKQSQFDAWLDQLKKKKSLEEQGSWVFYPWISTLVHVLPEADFLKVRTTRNQDLVTREEQKKFYNAVVGIGGLSIGSSIASTLVFSGGAKYLKLADFDNLELSNTNRIRTGVQNLGVPKVNVSARELYLMNPYMKIQIFRKGLTEQNLEKFIAGAPRLNVMVDEMDNLAVKYRVREVCKKHKVPVIMGADNGDGIVVDVERYDLDKDTPFFHGRLGNVTHAELASLDKMGIGRTIGKHVGPENVCPRMIDSLGKVGKTIVSWPQLGTAATLNGVALTYCVRRIANGQSLIKNRTVIKPELFLDPEYNTETVKKDREGKQKVFAKMLGIDN